MGGIVFLLLLLLFRGLGSDESSREYTFNTLSLALSPIRPFFFFFFNSVVSDIGLLLALGGDPRFKRARMRQ